MADRGTRPSAGAAGVTMLLEETARVFHETGQWPVWQYLDRVLDREGFVPTQVVEGVPRDVLRLPGRLDPDAPVLMTVLGLARTRAGSSETDLFLDVLVWCVQRERDSILGAPHEATPLILTSDSYRDYRNGRGLLSDALTIRKAHTLLQVEDISSGGGSNPTTGDWTANIDNRIRAFRGVRTLDDFWAAKGTPAGESVTGADPVLGPETQVGGHANGSVEPQRVLVVHGRNTATRDGIYAFLRALGLSPIEWSQAVQWTQQGSPYIGDVLDAAFAKAAAVVVLMTPDEVAYLRTDYASNGDADTQPGAQSRPNVLFEAGMAMGRDAQHTILVEVGEVRPFSDIAGRHAVRLDNSAPKRNELAQRLRTAGCEVDTTGDGWLTAGDLTPPPPPGKGIPLGRKLPVSRAPVGVSVDLRYHERQHGGRLEIINRGPEAIYDLDLVLPPDIENFHLVSRDLPIDKLPGGKSVMLIALRTMGRGRDHFEIRVTGRTEDGTLLSDDVFVSLLN